MTFVSTGLLPRCRPARTSFAFHPDCGRGRPASAPTPTRPSAGGRPPPSARTTPSAGRQSPASWPSSARSAATSSSVCGRRQRRRLGRRVRQIPRGVDGVALHDRTAGDGRLLRRLPEAPSGPPRHVVMSADPRSPGARAARGHGRRRSFRSSRRRPPGRATCAIFKRLPEYHGVARSTRRHLRLRRRRAGARGDRSACTATCRTANGASWPPSRRSALRDAVGTLRARPEPARRRAELPHPGREGAERQRSSAQTVGVVPNVETDFGGYFTRTSPPDSETQPVCRKGHVPAWAR